MLRILVGWVCNLAPFWCKLWEDSLCEWPLTFVNYLKGRLNLNEHLSVFLLAVYEFLCVVIFESTRSSYGSSLPVHLEYYSNFPGQISNWFLIQLYQTSHKLLMLWVRWIECMFVLLWVPEMIEILYARSLLILSLN